MANLLSIYFPSASAANEERLSLDRHNKMILLFARVLAIVNSSRGRLSALLHGLFVMWNGWNAWPADTNLVIPLSPLWRILVNFAVHFARSPIKKRYKSRRLQFTRNDQILFCRKFRSSARCTSAHRSYRRLYLFSPCKYYCVPSLRNCEGWIQKSETCAFFYLFRANFGRSCLYLKISDMIKEAARMFDKICLVD